MKLAQKTTIRSILQLIRAQNLLIIFASQIFIKFSIINEFRFQSLLFDINFLKISIGTTLITAAGYIINDYYDVKIDVINRPLSVVVERVISRKQAIIAHSIITFVALLIGLSINVKIFIIFTLSSLLLWWYSNYLKKKPFWGNLSIACLSATSVLVMAVAYSKNTIPLYFYSSLIFTITLIREIIKDMEDLNGDKAYGCKTLPIVFGIRKTKGFIVLLLLLFILLILSTPLFLASTMIYSLFVILLLPLVTKFFFILPKADTIKQFHQLSSLCKWMMSIGVLSILFMR